VREFARALLPFADPATVAPFERDFAERPRESNVARISGSRPASRASVARVSPEAETRIEEPPASKAPPALGAAIRDTASSPRRIDPLPCPAGASPFRIKGLHYRSFMFHVSRSVGIEALEGRLEDESLVRFVRQPFLASRRYDIFPFLPLFNTLARLLGVSFDTLIRTSTAAQVRYDARTAYKLILDVSRPEDIADRVGRFNSQLYNFGNYSASVPEKNQVDVVFEQIPEYVEPWFEPMHIVYALESLRLSGARTAAVVSHVAEKAGTRDGYRLRTYRTRYAWDS
jgi:hypothetical protein